MKVAIIGTVGVPAKYGGFETLVENLIVENNLSEVEYTVYCSRESYTERPKTYRGATLEYIGLKANGPQSVLYDIISIIQAVCKSDILLILGVSGAIILPLVRFFSKKQIIVNIDGLEHRRNKWNSGVRKFLKWSEKLAVYNADIIVADNKGIQDYVKLEYGKDSALIAYGGDHVQCDIRHVEKAVLELYGLQSGDFGFSVCRIEPENNVHLTLEAYAITGDNLVFVGNWDNSQYGIDLKTKYGVLDNIKILQPIYDLAVLNVLRSNCRFYLHGHSAGGTNPSLVEAMFFGKAIFAYDCVYNRETTEGNVHYFNSCSQLVNLISQPYINYEKDGVKMLEIAHRNYCWKIIARQYEELYLKSNPTSTMFIA